MVGLGRPSRIEDNEEDLWFVNVLMYNLVSQNNLSDYMQR